MKKKILKRSWFHFVWPQEVESMLPFHRINPFFAPWLNIHNADASWIIFLDSCKNLLTPLLFHLCFTSVLYDEKWLCRVSDLRNLSQRSSQASLASKPSKTGELGQLALSLLVITLRHKRNTVLVHVFELILPLSKALFPSLIRLTSLAICLSHTAV